MKDQYKYLSAIAINGILCLFLALPAAAQRPGSGGSSSSSSSSGSSSRSSSSSSSSSSGSSSRSSSSNSGGNYRSSSSGNSNSYRPAPSYASRPSSGIGYRPGNNNPRVAIAPPRINSQGIRPPANRVGFLGNTGIASGNYGNRGYVAPAPGNVVGTRGYVGAGGRGSAGSGGHGFYSPYWGKNGYYHYYHGYYNTYYAPRLGFRIGFLPYGYYSFYYDDFPYFYSDGLFYSYDNSQYTVVEPPIGAEVTTLPSNAQSIVINGQQYYEADGVYYEPVTKDDGTVVYQVAGKDGELNTSGDNNQVQQAPQVGDVVAELPADCRKISINGEKFYVSPDGYYYQETKDQNGNKMYKIVGTPSDEPDQQ